MIRYQETSDLFCFIANYHGMTTVPDGKKLATGVVEAAASFVALGLDPDRTTFWVQSDVPEVQELTWVLSNFTPVGLLERCHSYKDKIAKGISPNHGLFAYPVLMAADILMYGSNVVPVGRDQKQHVEVARDIAIKFNNEYGEILVVPEVEIADDVAVVPGVDGQKMSKSYNNAIDIFTDRDTLKNMVMSIVTDSAPVEAPKDPDADTLFAIYRLFLDKEAEQELRDRYTAGGLKYVAVKKELIDVIWDYFSDYRDRRQELLDNPTELRGILAKGAEKARAEAAVYMDRVREATGITY
jgi:tryptophanyl-tRNA synthetase